MSNVMLAIGGRNFTVACAPGEEAHVAGLGRMIDGKLAAMGELGSQSESRMLLFAALLLADELHDARSAVAAAQASAVAGEDASPALAGRLDAMASRLENLAGRLETLCASA